jgi:hypothetical protein
MKLSATLPNLVRLSFSETLSRDPTKLKLISASTVNLAWALPERALLFSLQFLKLSKYLVSQHQCDAKPATHMYYCTSKLCVAEVASHDSVTATQVIYSA